MFSTHCCILIALYLESGQLLRDTTKSVMGLRASCGAQNRSEMEPESLMGIPGRVCDEAFL